VLDGEHAPSIPANACVGDVVSCRFLETSMHTPAFVCMLMRSV
jgi:hypothetical protein